jgi:thiamine biosynthesis lipoprotein
MKHPVLNYGLIFCLCAVMAAVGCRGRQEATPPREFMAMGTLASIRTGADEMVSPETVEREVRAEFADLEGRLSIYRPDSEISRLNAAGTNPVAISPATRVILKQAIHYGEVSGGAFDVTIGPLVRLWGFSGGKVPRGLPDEKALEEARKRVGFQLIILDASRVAMREPGMFVDLGGIAKGYAVDCAWTRVQAEGGQNVLINLGGNMRVMGRPASDRLWRVGVRNPFDGDSVMGHLELVPGQAVATSGNYERFMMIEGHRYAHILDPRTSRPVEGMAGVTVLAPTATEADAWSTILFIVGIEAGQALLADHPGIEALWVPDREPHEIRVTPGLAKVFQPVPEWRGLLKINHP